MFILLLCVSVCLCVFVCIYQPPVSLAIFDFSGIFYFLFSFGHILVLGNHNNGKIMKIRQEKTEARCASVCFGLHRGANPASMGGAWVVSDEQWASFLSTVLIVAGPFHFFLEVLKWTSAFRIRCSRGLRAGMFTFIETSEYLQVIVMGPKIVFKRSPTKTKSRTTKKPITKAPKKGIRKARRPVPAQDIERTWTDPKDATDAAKHATGGGEEADIEEGKDPRRRHLFCIQSRTTEYQIRGGGAATGHGAKQSGPTLRGRQRKRRFCSAGGTARRK